MLLGEAGGNEFELSIIGYQFPDAEDPALRFSWHMVAGRVASGDESWTFRWQALTCDEPARIVAWLRSAAAALDDPATDPPGSLHFTEPNLAFTIVEQRNTNLTVGVDLDQEFKPPSHASRSAGTQLRVPVSADSAMLLQAASDLEADLGTFPDGLAPPHAPETFGNRPNA